MKSPIYFGWLTLEMIKLDDYRANSQIFHEMAFFLCHQFLWTFHHFGFRVVWFKDS